MTDASSTFAASTSAYVPPPVVKTEGVAITALVTALLAFAVGPFSPLLAITALVLASSSKRNIAASNGERKGKRVAIAAQLIAVAALVLTVAIVVPVVLFA